MIILTFKEQELL